MLKKFLRWLTRTSIYRYILINIIPYIRTTTYYTSFRGWKYKRGYVKLQKGDIVLTADKKKLTSFLIPGEFAHASLCVAKNSEWEISEMTHTDYTKSTFFDICKESDRVVILRCKEWDPLYLDKVVDKCKSFQDAVYDVSFVLGIKELYCSELVYQADFEYRLDINLEDLAGLGQKYISPTGLFKALNCEVVWDSDLETQS